MFNRKNHATSHAPSASSANCHHGRQETNEADEIISDFEDLYVRNDNAWFPDFYATDEIDMAGAATDEAGTTIEFPLQ